VGTDANAHHTAWGSTNVNPRGELLLEYVASTNLDICNIGNEPTFITQARKEVLDITLADLATCQTVEGWHVDKKEVFPDHRLIRWKIHGPTSPEERWRNPRRCSWEAYELRLKQALLERDSNPLTSADAAANEIREISGILTGVFDECCPLTKKGGGPKPKWPAELKELQTDARKAQRKAHLTGSDEDWEVKREKLRLFKKAQKKFDRDQWRQHCSEIEQIPPTARFVKMLKKDKRSQLGVIRKIDGTYTDNPKDTIETLLLHHFPRATQASGRAPIRPPRMEEGGDLSEVRRIVTTSRVKMAIQSFAPYKAAGLDGIIPKMLSCGGNTLVHQLRDALQGCLLYGVIPDTWRKAKVVFIPKPGKDDYQEPKNFRPVSLTSFLLKTMEKVMDMYLEEGNCTPTHPNQFAYRKGRSTEAALHQLVSRIEEAYYGGEFALVVLLDISGAFDRASHDALEEAMRHNEVNRTIRHWISKMLRQREATATLLGSTAIVGVERGTPQGGVGSPRLWNMLVDDLLHRTAEWHTGAYVQAFADDISIVLRGTDPSTLRDIASLVLDKIKTWAMDKGLALNADKTEVMMFTRRRKWSRAPLVALGTDIPLRKEARYLGVILDERLTWKAHCQSKAKACATAMMACRRAIGPTWGLKPETAHWIYTAIVRPMLSYGACVWIPALSRSTRTRELTRVQRLGCLMITSAFHTTPTAALEKMLDLVPIDLYIQQAATEQYLRLQSEQLWRDRTRTCKSHTGAIRLIARMMPALVLPCDAQKTTHTGQKAYSVHIDSRTEALERWQRGKTVTRKEYLVYTDGSRRANATGFGYTISLSGNNTDIHRPLGKLATVNQAELLAILESVETIKAMADNHKIPVAIHSDSQACLRALQATTTKSSLIEQCVLALNELGKEHRVLLRWVPGHHDIDGNERADRLAKEGAATPFLGPEPAIPVPPSTRKTAIEEAIYKAWKQRWKERPDCRQSKMYIKRVEKKTLLQLSRRDLRNITTCFTGHGNLGHHLHIMGLKGDSSCQFCGAKDETPQHFVGMCPKFTGMRWRIYGRPVLHNAEWTTLDLNKLRKYITETERLEILYKD
jgi:ribonuclease HI